MVVETRDYPYDVSREEFETLIKQACGFYRCGLCLHKPIIQENDESIILSHHGDEFDSIVWPIRITTNNYFLNIEYAKYNWYSATIEGVNTISLRYSPFQRYVRINNQKYYCKKSDHPDYVCIESTQSNISQISLSFWEGSLDNISYSIGKQRFGGRLYRMSAQDYQSIVYTQKLL